MAIDPVAGRFFVPEEDRTHATHAAVVISERLWRSEFGADPDAVGSEIRVDPMVALRYE